MRTLELAPWPRLGGNALFLNLYPLMEGARGLYVGEIPPGGALNPENHLYEELIYILSGFGATEIWSAGDDKRKMHFEWQQGSLFAIPLNTRHRMINGSREPAFFLAHPRTISAFGQSCTTRGILPGSATIGGLTLLTWRGVRGWPGQVALVATAAALLTSSLNSHAAALLSGSYLGVAADWLHFVGVAAWLGGLASMVYVLPIAVQASQASGDRVQA